MLDLIGDAVLGLLEAWLSPDGVAARRVGRLASTAIAGSIVAALHFSAPSGIGWILVALGAAAAAAWVAALSTVDLLKEVLSVAWLSGTTAVFGAWAAIAGVSFALRAPL